MHPVRFDGTMPPGHRPVLFVITLPGSYFQPGLTARDIYRKLTQAPGQVEGILQLLAAGILHEGREPIRPETLRQLAEAAQRDQEAGRG